MPARRIRLDPCGGDEAEVLAYDDLHAGEAPRRLAALEARRERVEGGGVLAPLAAGEGEQAVAVGVVGALLARPLVGVDREIEVRCGHWRAAKLRQRVDASGTLDVRPKFAHPSGGTGSPSSRPSAS
ncbi:hypothetical protein BE11_02770 [Sorangium cellulosum]|nr:hypothetical protein BE11_02770 [Sorangium cellulosum]